jgi:hypothetical protein
MGTGRELNMARPRPDAGAELVRNSD